MAYAEGPLRREFKKNINYFREKHPMKDLLVLGGSVLAVTTEALGWLMVTSRGGNFPVSSGELATDIQGGLEFAALGLLIVGVAALYENALGWRGRMNTFEKQTIRRNLLHK